MATFSFTVGIDYARNNPGKVIRTESVPGWVIYLIYDDSCDGTFILRIAEPVADGLGRAMTWHSITVDNVVRIIAAVVAVSERHGQAVEMDQFDRIALATPDLFVDVRN